MLYNYFTSQMVGEREKRPLTRILRHGEKLWSLRSFSLRYQELFEAHEEESRL